MQHQQISGSTPIEGSPGKKNQYDNNYINQSGNGNQHVYKNFLEGIKINDQNMTNTKTQFNTISTNPTQGLTPS